MSIKQPPRPRPQCGTPAGHRQHAKRGEHQCEACRKAWREYHRAYRNGEDLARFRSPVRSMAVIRAEQERIARRWLAMDDEQLREQARAAEE